MEAILSHIAFAWKDIVYVIGGNAVIVYIDFLYNAWQIRVAGERSVDMFWNKR